MGARLRLEWLVPRVSPIRTLSLALTARSLVQVPGTAFCIRHDVLKKNIAEDGLLREVLEKYAIFALLAFAQIAACNRLHHLEERCCRWLLIAHDSALSDTFQLTQEFLAMMLGVQRAGVSIPASFLQKAGLIQYRRGQVTIRDRSGLENAACECYREMLSQQRRSLGKTVCHYVWNRTDRRCRSRDNAQRSLPDIISSGQAAFAQPGIVFRGGSMESMIARLNIERFSKEAVRGIGRD